MSVKLLALLPWLHGVPKDGNMRCSCAWLQLLSQVQSMMVSMQSCTIRMWLTISHMVCAGYLHHLKTC